MGKVGGGERDPESVKRRCTRSLSHHGFAARRPRDVLSDLLPSISAEEEPDHYGRGRIIADFERRIADHLGKPDALFLPTGTMAQQIALRIWCDERGSDRVGLHATSHLLLHEEMALEHLHRIRPAVVGPPDGLMGVDDLAAIPDRSTLLVELPQREIGGPLMSWDALVALTSHARVRGIRLHLDGARLWECAPAYGRPVAEIAAPFDSVYVSFYKTLGAVAGAALAGPHPFVDEARVWQRRHGGNPIALWPYVASARRAMDLRLGRIPAYVDAMQSIASGLEGGRDIAVEPPRPPTNMAHIRLRGDAARLAAAALEVSEATGVWLFSGLAADPEGGWARFELSAGDATLELAPAEVRNLLEMVVAKAAEM